MAVIVSDNCQFIAENEEIVDAFKDDTEPICAICDDSIKREDIPIVRSNRYLISSRRYYCSLECWKVDNPNEGSKAIEKDQMDLFKMK